MPPIDYGQTMPDSAQRSKVTYALLILLTATAFFYLSDINNNHRWWGDFALYMAHAKNIATLSPYAETGFVFNSHLPRYSPPAYPPVYPAMLAPVVMMFDLNLYAPKILNLIIFLASLVVFYVFCTRRLVLAATQLIAVTLVAFSPWFWNIKNLILSEIPFILFTFAALLVIDRLAVLSRHQTAYWLVAVLLGLLIYLSYGTRILGLLLIPTLLVFDLAKNRSFRAGPLLALCIFLILHQVQHSYLTPDIDQSYADTIVNEPAPKGTESSVNHRHGLLVLAQEVYGNVLTNLEIYGKVLLNHWDNTASLPIRLAITALTGLLTLAGFIQLIRTRPSSLELFTIFYMGVLLIVPFHQGTRYLLPVLPAYILYCCKGAEVLATRLSGGTSPRLYVPALLLIFTGLSYTHYYFNTYGEEHYFGVADDESTELFEYIRNNTTPDSHIKFQRARILALFTGRKSSMYNLAARTPDKVWDDFQPAGVSHLLVYTGEYEWAHKIKNDAFIELHQENLVKIFENTYFRLYKVSYPNT